MSTSNFEREKRIRIWRAGWLLIRDNPVLGIGYGNFGKRIGEYSSERGISEVVGHSMYITTASESGVFALLLFLCILGYGAYRINIIRSKLDHQHDASESIQLLALQTGLIAYAVNGIFLDTHFEADFWIFLGIIQAVILLSGNSEIPVRTYQDSQPRAEYTAQSSFTASNKNT